MSVSGGTETGPRLTGQRLTMARLAWVLGIALGIALYVLSIPLYYNYFETICPGGAQCAGSLSLTPQQVQELGQLGLSLRFYGYYLTFLWALSPSVSLVVGGLIFWRRSEDRMALFSSFALTAYGLSSSIYTDSWALQVPAKFYQTFAQVCLVVFVLVFPNGRFVPRWTRWLALIFALREVLGSVSDNEIWQVLLIVEIAAGILLQAYRYRRVSNAIQRQQTKWVVLGLGVALGGFGMTILFFMFDPRPDAVTGLLGVTAFTLWFVGIPISIGLAILRSRLWDIDLIIRRTLIYGVVTALLALVYFGGVLLLQELLRGVTRQNSELAIILSTLAIAALFTPLRGRVQNAIDRRFYRRKYDSAQVLARFAARVRDGVELDEITAELLTVVDETLQPAQATVWLRDKDSNRQV